MTRHQRLARELAAITAGMLVFLAAAAMLAAALAASVRLADLFPLRAAAAGIPLWLTEHNRY